MRLAQDSSEEATIVIAMMFNLAEICMMYKAICNTLSGLCVIINTC